MQFNNKQKEKIDSTMDENRTVEKFYPRDYGKVADHLLALVEKTGGLKKNLYLEKYSSGKEVRGLAWSFIISWLQFFKNEQTEETYKALVDRFGFSKDDLKQIWANPFKKCSEHLFFALQYAVLSYYDNLDYDHERRVVDTVTVRTSAFQLMYERKDSLSFKIIPFHIIGKLSGIFASKYTTISESKSTSLTSIWKKKKVLELEFVYTKTPKRFNPQLNRPKKLVVNGKEYNPSEETIYNTGIPDYFSMVSHPITTLGILYFKSLYVNTRANRLALPVLPDEMPQFHDGRRYQMNDDGYLFDIDNPEGDLLRDSLGKLVHYGEKAIFALDKDDRVIYDLSEKTIKTDSRVNEVIEFNSNKNHFLIYYDMLMPWQKFYAQMAMKLRDEILSRYNLDVMSMDYNDLKKLLLKHYGDELKTEWRRLNSAKIIPILSLIAGVLSWVFLGDIPILQKIALFISGLGVSTGIGIGLYKDLIRRVESLKQKDTRDVKSREEFILSKLSDEKANANGRANKTLDVFNTTIEEMKKTSASTNEILMGLEEFTKSNQANVEAQDKLQFVVNDLVELI
ncbi:hypothetical protein ACFL20_10735, partial [Spirochaetota bacterium]